MSISREKLDKARAKKSAAAKYAPTVEMEPVEAVKEEAPTEREHDADAKTTSPIELEENAKEPTKSTDTDANAGSAWEARQAQRAREKERRPIKHIRRQIVLKDEDAEIIDKAVEAVKASGAFASFNDFATETLIEAAYKILNK